MLTAAVSSAGGVGALVLSKLRGKKRTHMGAHLGHEQTESQSASFGEWIKAVQALEENQQH
jgi:hypothetical protein